jgi:hypothetical protein
VLATELKALTTSTVVTTATQLVQRLHHVSWVSSSRLDSVNALSASPSPGKPWPMIFLVLQPTNAASATASAATIRRPYVVLSDG